MFDLELFLHDQQQLREKYGKMFVNTLIMKDELARLAAMKETQVISTENGLYILKAEADFFRLYCFVDGREPEKAITGFLEQKRFDCPIVFDLVGRKKRIEKLKQHLNENAISPYAEYDRYILTDRITPRGFYQQLTDPDTIRFGFSEAKDAERIREIFLTNFDRFTSHIPIDPSVIKKRIENREICTIHCRDELTAVFCFEILDAENVHLNVIASSDIHDSLGFAPLLYEYVLDLFDDKTKFICWIEQNNEASIAMHDAFGFSQDNKMTLKIYKYGGN